jgi:hypothetical protein
MLDKAIARLYALHLEGVKAPEIASILNAEGYLTIRKKAFTQRLINMILVRFRSGVASRYSIAIKRSIG